MPCHMKRQQRQCEGDRRKKWSLVELSCIRTWLSKYRFKVIPHCAPRPPFFFEREKGICDGGDRSHAKNGKTCLSELCELSHSLPKSWRYSCVFSRVSSESRMISFSSPRCLFVLLCFWLFALTLVFNEFNE